MMTGKELIIYILMNDLEDAPVFEDGQFIGFMTAEEAAAEFEVGVATIRIWVNEGLLRGIRIDDKIFIPRNSENPKDSFK